MVSSFRLARIFSSCESDSAIPRPSSLGWQPPIDNTKTQLIAIIAPGPSFAKTKVAEIASIPTLGRKLVEHGYSAVGIRCKGGSDEEFSDAVSYATLLSETSGLTILHVAREGREVSGTPFSLSIRELWDDRRFLEAAALLAGRHGSQPPIGAPDALVHEL